MAVDSQASERATLRQLPNSTVVERLPVLLLIGVMLIAVASVGLLQVSQTSHLTTIGYELRSLETERSAISARVRLLEAEIANIARIDQVRNEAIERLGMSEPTETLRIAVTVPAPHIIPMPKRYVASEQILDPSPRSWWELLLYKLPRFNSTVR